MIGKGKRITLADETRGGEERRSDERMTYRRREEGKYRENEDEWKKMEMKTAASHWREEREKRKNVKRKRKEEKRE